MSASLHIRASLYSIIAVAGFGCTGELRSPLPGQSGDGSGAIGDAGAAPGVGAPGVGGGPAVGQPSACEESRRGLSEAEHRRLTRSEIVASLRAIFGDEVMADERVGASLLRISPEGSFSREDPFNGSIRDVEGMMDVAGAIGDALFGKASSPCGDESSCRAWVAAELAPIAWKRALSQEQADELEALMDEVGGEHGARIGLARVLLSPHFLHHMELAGEPRGERVRLSPDEVAARLSFRLTGAPPDGALRAAARSGGLESLEDVRAQALRLLDGEQARAQLRRAAASWLGIEQVPDPSPVAASELGIEADGLGQEAREEALRFIEHVVYEQRGDYEALTSSPVVFPFTERLAAIYGVERSDGPVELDVDDPRGGVALRIATLLSSDALTAPLHRGLVVRARMLCQVLELPPVEIVAEAMEKAVEGEITRERYSGREVLTRMTAGPSCDGCHVLVNPIGFALEELGPLGERRDEEIVYDEEGRVIARHPIDARVDDLFIGMSAQPAGGARDLARSIASAPAARACFAEQWFAQTRLRYPEADDACAVEEVTAALVGGRPILEAIADTVANEDIFWRADGEGR